MHTVMAWGEDEDRSGAETGLAGLADDLFVVSGDTIEMPTGYPYVAMAYVMTEFAAYQLIKARLTAPSITQRPLQLTRNLHAGVALQSEFGVYDWRHMPIGPGNPPFIKAGDKITAYSYEEDEAGVAHKNSIALIVSDGAIPIGLSPANIIHHCTPGAAIATALTWQTITLTESNALEAGTYDMYGADVVSASAIAARFIFPGNNDVGRPAVIPRRIESQGLHPFSAMWGKPVRFTYPGGLPKLELVCETTDTADHVNLLLRQVSK